MFSNIKFTNNNLETLYIIAVVHVYVTWNKCYQEFREIPTSSDRNSDDKNVREIPTSSDRNADDKNVLTAFRFTRNP